jgi:hypothetical protein
LRGNLGVRFRGHGEASLKNVLGIPGAARYDRASPCGGSTMSGFLRATFGSLRATRDAHQLRVRSRTLRWSGQFLPPKPRRNEPYPRR